MEEALFKQLFLVLTLCFFSVRVYYDYNAGKQHVDKPLNIRIKEQIANEGYPSMLLRFIAFPILLIMRAYHGARDGAFLAGGWGLVTL